MTDKRTLTNRKNARKPRIRPELSEAIRLMVFGGLSRPEAAATVGMSDHGLYQALRKPHVKRLYAQEHRDLRSGAAILAYSRMVDLMESSRSEHVQLRACQWIAGVGGIAPAKKVAQASSHGFDVIGFAPRSSPCMPVVARFRYLYSRADDLGWRRVLL